MKIGHLSKKCQWCKKKQQLYIWRGQTRLENTAGTFSIYLATYNIESDPYRKK